MTLRTSLYAMAVAASSPVCAQAQPTPSYGIDFVTIGDPGNTACMLPDPGGTSYTTGRGSVGYEYRIARMEVTTSQWMEFVNTYAVLGGPWSTFGRPTFWGAQIDVSYPGPGERYELRGVPSAGLLPVGGITWREAAMYCNWLHNGKSPGLASIQNGAYDTSTFTTNPDGTFNDQATRSPEARFWIPSLDEWIKAAHYDPARFGPGQGGWWMYPHGSDSPPLYGQPGQGQANSGFQLPSAAEWDVPLGSYLGGASPLGLLDAAGGAAEWIEEIYAGGFGSPATRGVDGSAAGWGAYGAGLNDRITRLSSETPGSAPPWQGLRIASSVPGPSTFTSLAVLMLTFSRRSSRSHQLQRYSPENESQHRGPAQSRLPGS